VKALFVASFTSMSAMLTSVVLAQSPESVVSPGVPPATSADAPGPTFRHRALIGLTAGPLATATTVNGKRVAGWDTGSTGILEFGLEERFTRRFSVAVRARRSGTSTEWAGAVGYQRNRWDLGLEPRLWVRPPHALRIETYLGVGSGVTLTSEKAPARRAYEERIEGIPGYFFSTCIGATHGWETSALFLEVGYAFHSTRVEATFEPRAPWVERTVEDRHYADHAGLVTLGLVLGFGAL
jgi:hypothetical protein